MPSSQKPLPKESDFLVRALAVTAVALTVLSCILIWSPESLLPQSGAQPTSGVYMGDGIAILEPKYWVGQSFPLFSYVDVGERLDEGEWSMFLCRRDSANSLRMLESEHFREQVKRGFQVALVEVPSSSENLFPPLPSGVVKGQLDGRMRCLSLRGIWNGIRDDRVVIFADW